MDSSVALELELAPASSNNSTVMVVEDDQDILDALTAILGTKGYQVLAIDSADQVMPLIEKDPPQLILLDIWVGGGDGRDVFKQLRQHPVGQTIPVIFVSANMSTPQIARDLQVDDFIMKPFDVDYLLSVVDKHLIKDD